MRKISGSYRRAGEKATDGGKSGIPSKQFFYFLLDLCLLSHHSEPSPHLVLGFEMLHAL
jgi:hypothetical protein